MFPPKQKYLASDMNGLEPRKEASWWFSPSPVCETIFVLLFCILLFHTSPSAGDKSVFSASGVAGCIIISVCCVSLQWVYRICLLRLIAFDGF